MCALEPQGDLVHGDGGVDDFAVASGIDQAACAPHVFPEVGAVGAYAPVVQFAEGLGDWLALFPETLVLAALFEQIVFFYTYRGFEIRIVRLLSTISIAAIINEILLLGYL